MSGGSEEEAPYQFYAADRLDITRWMMVHLIKAKLPLNHVTDENYHYVLQREGVRCVWVVIYESAVYAIVTNATFCAWANLHVTAGMYAIA